MAAAPTLVTGLPPVATTAGTGDELGRALQEAQSCVDRMQALVRGSARGRASSGSSSLRAHVSEVERLGRRLDAVRLALLATADGAGVADRGGHLDTGSWLAEATNGDRRPASRDVSLAVALQGDQHEGDPAPAPGSAGERPGASGAAGAGSCGRAGSGEDRPTAPSSPSRRAAMSATSQALESGEISVEHARVIASALRSLPEDLLADERTTCETRLLQLAAHRSPSRLRLLARRAVEEVRPEPEAVDAHEDAVVASEEQQAEERSRFWITVNHDGTMTGQFTVPWASGAVLRKVIDAMTAPRRQAPTGPASSRQWGDAGTRKAAALDWQHRRGLALADLLLRLPTDHLASKVAATLLVTTRLEDLQGELARVGRTDAGDQMSAGQTRRIACGAGIIPAVLGGESLPVDLGTQRRLFSDAQRVALSSTYTECAAEGCDRPFAWTEIHHLRPWQAGGRTDLDNAVPLCGRHHRMIDGPDWQHTVRRSSPDDPLRSSGSNGSGGSGEPNGSSARPAAREHGEDCVAIRFHRRT